MGLRATIITEPASYGPISLLQSDIKILAKVLGRRLNTVIADVIHADQEGFMPNKSMAINLRWLFRVQVKLLTNL